jgi:uncharacterized DUF497 family protein
MKYLWYSIYTVMEFEFDDRKSRSNMRKHGIDFVEAQALWDDPDLLEVPLRTDDEPRRLVIGRVGGKHWSAIVTDRRGHVRIISVRRSRDHERDLYES